MDLAKKEGIVLKSLYLLPKKYVFGIKEQELTFTGIIDTICREENLSYGYTKKIIMACIKKEMITKVEEKYYSINKQLILQELEKDRDYQLTFKVIEDQHTIII